MSNKKSKINEIWNSKNLFGIIKTIFLITLTTLVIINTFTLAYLVPIIGSHVIPDNQGAAELWRVVTQIMGVCILLIIVCGVIYGIAGIVNGIEKEVKHE